MAFTINALGIKYVEVHEALASNLRCNKATLFDAVGQRTQSTVLILLRTPEISTSGFCE